MEPFHGMLLFDFRCFPSGPGIGIRRSDQTQPEAVGILKRKGPFPQTRFEAVMPYLEALKTIFPEFQTPFRHGVTDFGGHPCARNSLPYPGPRKKGNQGSRRSYPISKIEMIGLRIVKIDCLLYQTQTQRLCIKVVITLCIARDGGNMMQPEYLIFHNSPYRIIGIKKEAGLNLLHQLNLSVQPYFITHHDSAGFQGSVPVKSPIFPVDFTAD